MMNDLGTDVITIRWVVTAYMIANAVVMPLVGWLARACGARTCISVSADICQQYGGLRHGTMCLCHCFSGLKGGGGLIMPVDHAVMLDLYPTEKRGLGTSIWSMGPPVAPSPAFLWEASSPSI